MGEATLTKHLKLETLSMILELFSSGYLNVKGLKALGLLYSIWIEMGKVTCHNETFWT